MQTTEQGIFITFEGGDGAGKSTQVQLLAQHLQACGREVCLLHEPGGTSVGEKIRAVLLDKAEANMVPMAELLLYEAARAQIVAEVIHPAIAAGKVVICDRFADSTTAYQGWGRELDAQIVSKLNEVATNGLQPDRTILLQIEPSEGLQRAVQASEDGAPDRMEAAGDAFHQRVNAGFDAIAQAEPGRVRRVSAAGTIGEVQRAVFEALADLLPGIPAPSEGGAR